MTKLTDTQAIILSNAANRERQVALPLPDSLRGGAAAKVVGAMLANPRRHSRPQAAAEARTTAMTTKARQKRLENCVMNPPK